MYATVEGIVINQKDRQKNGTVEKGQEYEELRDEIIQKLLQLKDPDTGERVVAEAYKREEIYKGNFLKNAPDIILNFTPDYIGGVELEGNIISPVQTETTNVFSGIHNQDGIFIFYGPNVKKGIIINPVNIIDVVPTILYDLNLPIPDDIDGKIIEKAFLDTYKINLPRYITAEKKPEKTTMNGLSKEDEESMKKALKGLGYLN
jgi:predicted AlkP superfamily phosphohydrolase/phosphomutase